MLKCLWRTIKFAIRQALTYLFVYKLEGLCIIILFKTESGFNTFLIGSNSLILGKHKQRFTSNKNKVKSLRKRMQGSYLFFLKKIGHPGLFLVYFGLFKQTLQYLQQINLKNVHPVDGAGIWSDELQNISFIPYPLDQGFRPYAHFCLYLDL